MFSAHNNHHHHILSSQLLNPGLNVYRVPQRPLKIPPHFQISNTYMDAHNNVKRLILVYHR